MPTINAIGTPQITLGGTFTMSGAYTFIGQLTGNTNVTFPTSGTLATTGGTVISLQGTANQVLVNGTSGTPVTGTAITLSTPQDIATTSSPTFQAVQVNLINDSNGLPVVAIAGTLSSVNYLTIASSIAGANTNLVATGASTDIGINYSAKNAGGHFFSSTSVQPIAFFSGTALQHETVFQFANTAANRTVLWPDADGTVAFTSGASGIVSPGLINQIGYYAVAGSTISGLTIANQGVLTTNGTGVPAWVPLIAGQILVGTTSGAPVAAAINSGTNITVANGSGSITVNLSGIVSPVLGGTGVNNGANTLTLAGTLATSGAFASVFTMTGATNVTFPTSGTLATTTQLVTPAALTKTDDTNVTLTLGGSPSTALVNAASLTLGWSGQLALTRGGSNASLTASNGGIVYSTASAMAILAGTATANLPLLSGSSAAPVWGAFPLSLGGALTTAGVHTLAGAFASTFTFTGATSVTFPTSGTLATTAGASGIVNSGTAGQLAYYAGSGTTVSGLALGTGVLTALGVNVNGSGAISLTTSPTFVTPILGAAAATSINFGGTSLANYVEGTWTPAFVGSGGGSATYSLQQGSYTRIGNRVLFDMTIIISGSTLSGNITISGLPLSVGNGNGAASGYYASMGATATPNIITEIVAGSSSLSLFVFVAGGVTALTSTNLGTSAVMAISGQYTLT